jgi:hypothetical protein
VLDDVLQVEEHPWRFARIALVHQHGAAAQQVAVAFEGEGERRVEQRVARADECGERLALWCDEGLLEDDALVARQYRLPYPNEPIAIAHRRRDVGDLVPPGLPLADRSAELLERFEEEGLDIVGLQAPGLGALHILAHPSDPTRVHGIVRERPLLQQFLEPPPIDGVRDDMGELRAHLGALAVADRLDQKIPQWPRLEL